MLFLLFFVHTQQTFFPPISDPEGLPLRVQDVKGQEWTFQFRFWPNNNSRMYVLEGITPCIQSLELQAGDTGKYLLFCYFLFKKNPFNFSAKNILPRPCFIVFHYGMKKITSMKKRWQKNNRCGEGKDGNSFVELWFVSYPRLLGVAYQI